MMLAFVWYFTATAFARHDAFLSTAYDLGIYDQVAWNTATGRPFFYTTPGSPQLHFSNHADPVMLIVGSFYLVYSSPKTLIFVQALFVAAPALVVYWLGRRKLEGAWTGAAFAAAYLLFPTAQIITLWDFHPPALATGCLAFAFYFLYHRRPVQFFVFAVLAMACKEQIPLLIALMGLWAALWHRPRQPITGAAAFVLGVAWFVFDMYWLIPRYSVTGESMFEGFFDHLGHGPLEILLAVFTRPDIVLPLLLEPGRLRYVYDLFAPFGFLSFLSPPTLAVAASSLGINLLSNNPAMHDAHNGQYGATVAPLVAIAAVFGGANLLALARRALPGVKPAHISAAIGCAVLAAGAAYSREYGFAPFSVDPPRYPVTGHARVGSDFIRQIPTYAPLSAQNTLYPHLAHRRIAYMFPDVNEAVYIALDVTGFTWPLHPVEFKERYDEIIESGEFGVLDAEHGFILLRRGEGNTSLPDAFYDFARLERPPDPEYPLYADFGGRLQLLGYDVERDVRQRDWPLVRLYLQVPPDAETGGDLRLRPSLLDSGGSVLDDMHWTPPVAVQWYPPSKWKPGEIIVVETTPVDVGGRFTLVLGVQVGDDPARMLPVTETLADWFAPVLEGGRVVRLGVFEQKGQRREFEQVVPPDSAPGVPLPADFGGEISLTGYTLHENALTLHWLAQERIEKDYTLFVHVLDSSGSRVYQSDTPPSDYGGPLPTTAWQPGEVVVDTHALPGGIDKCTILVGWYYWETMERLPVLDGSGSPAADAVELPCGGD